MKKRAATGRDESAAHQEQIRSKKRLDDWLDDALADTFPASDAVASPPSDAGRVRKAGAQRRASRKPVR